MNDAAHIELDPQVVAALSAAADARGLSVEQYLRAITLMPDEVATGGQLELDDFDRWLDELAESPATAAGPATAASLPADFSRADVYCNPKRGEAGTTGRSRPRRSSV